MNRCIQPAQMLWVVLLSLAECLTSCGPATDYASDVHPVLMKHCSGCHRPGGGGPFPLLTYRDASRRAKMIAFVTGSGYMPPWPADRNYTHFLNENGLTQDEISLLRKWYQDGCPPGDTANLPLYLNQQEGVLGKPDTILNLSPVQLLGNNRDKFYVMKIPFVLPEGKYIRTVEFFPGQPDYAHHVNGHYLRFSDHADPATGTRIADVESDNYFNEFEQLKLLNPDGSLPQRVHSAVNYLPGSFGVRYPEGIGGFYAGKRGAFVLNDIHYGPSTKQVTDSSSLGIWYAEKPPERPVYEVMLGTNGVSEIIPPLVIPPDQITTHRTSMTVYNDISVLTVNPHMHMIGKSFLAYALKPNGDTIRLIHLPKWQFRWQYFYTFQHPVKIPKGSEIIVEAVYDNTAFNPNNPFDPPRQIAERLDRGGASMRTTDEMLQFIITYMAYKTGDENIDLSEG